MKDDLDKTITESRLMSIERLLSHIIAHVSVGLPIDGSQQFRAELLNAYISRSPDHEWNDLMEVAVNHATKMIVTRAEIIEADERTKRHLPIPLRYT